MKTRSFLVIMIACSLGFVFSGPARADELKDRMLKRVPAIDALLKKGVVGETRDGYLAFRGAKEQEDLVGAENADRKTVYAAIAKQQNTTPELVGRRRAAQIAEKAKPGTWLQDAKGNWYQK